MRYRPIRRNSEFSRCYARGKSYVHPQLVLYVLKTRSRRTRVGLTATKKVGNAVKRNRARRVMRAAIAEHLDYNIGGYDLVFVARAQTARVKSTQLSRTVAKLFAQAGLPDKAAGPSAAREGLPENTGETVFAPIQTAGGPHSGVSAAAPAAHPAEGTAPENGPAEGARP